MTQVITWVHYVRNYDVARWEALGWQPTDALVGTGHGDYSTLMVWGGEGLPEMPEREEQ